MFLKELEIRLSPCSTHVWLVDNTYKTRRTISQSIEFETQFIPYPKLKMKTFCLFAITFSDALTESQQEMKKLFPADDISRGKGRPNTGNLT